MVTLMLQMKYIRQRDTLMCLDNQDEEQITFLFNYLLNGCEHVTVAFLQTLAQHEDGMMILAERLKQEGIQQGALQKARGTARELRNAGMPTAQICQLSGLSEAELKNIALR